MTKQWGLEIKVEGEAVLAIGSHGHLSGDPNINDHADLLRLCANYLSSFSSSEKSPSLLPVKTPEFGRMVKAVIKTSIPGTNTWEVCTALLVAVDESDCTWRFTDDNSELSYSADVVYWEYADS